MVNEAYLAVTNAHRDLYARYAFYLLAVVGAAVGFALNQTQGAVLAWSQMPFGLAAGAGGIVDAGGNKEQERTPVRIRFTGSETHVEASLILGRYPTPAVLLFSPSRGNERSKSCNE